MYERYVFIQPETCEQSNWKYNAQCGNMRRETDLKIWRLEEMKIQIDKVVPDNEIIYKEIEHPVQNHITSSAHGIAKKLLWNQFFKGTIEKIYYFSYKMR